MHTSYGDMDIAIPRDRNGDYEPQLIKKYQDMEEKILSMYAKGMITVDIEYHMREMYDINVSDSTISRITDKILPIVKEWQDRSLEEVYQRKDGFRHSGAKAQDVEVQLSIREIQIGGQGNQVLSSANSTPKVSCRGTCKRCGNSKITPEAD